MANRTAIVSVGTALLIIGLTGLGLVQTGGIPPWGRSEAPAGKSSGLAAPGGPISQSVQNQAPQQLAAAPEAGAPAQTASAPAAQSAPVPEDLQAAPPLNRAPRRHARLKTSHRSKVAAHRAPSRHALRKSPFSRWRKRTVLGTRGNHCAHGRLAFSTTRPVVIRFTFDPDRNRPLGVAAVHLGDRIRISIQQVGQVDRRVYFTFAGGLNSRRGAILVLRTMFSFERPVYFRGASGYYNIQVRIYPHNRWRIRPRSLV